MVTITLTADLFWGYISTWLICYGNTHYGVDRMLSEDLKSLFGWITNSKMLINVKKSSVMWFSVRPLQSVTLSSIYVCGWTYTLVCGYPEAFG